MTRYLLDTNVLMHWVNKAEGFERIEERLIQIQPDRLFVSVVTMWEIYRMAAKAEYKHKVSTRACKALMTALEMFTPIELDAQSAALGGSLHAYLSNQGKTIGERDSMIAATAMSKRYTMVTDNHKEFSRVPGIVLENWRTG
jgi:tRNA(fMet)-specific endonuclease VapC